MKILSLILAVSAVVCAICGLWVPVATLCCSSITTWTFHSDEDETEE